MSNRRQLSRFDTIELKSHLFKKLGRQKSDKYLYYLNRFLCRKLSKQEFNKLCYTTIGKENIPLHNLLIRSILNNAIIGSGLHLKESANTTTKTPSGHFGDALLSPSWKGRSFSSKDRKFGDRPSPLGPLGKAINGGKAPLMEVISVEDGEEVEQMRCSPCVQSRSPIKAPIGLPKPPARKRMTDTELCSSSGELPDTGSMFARLNHRLQSEGLSLSADCASILNLSLDLYLKKLIKPCMDMAKSRSSGDVNNCHKRRRVVNEGCNATLHDFRVSMELNPTLLGSNWPNKLEKISLYK